MRKVGGFIQLAFAALWLIRGGLTAGGVTGPSITILCAVIIAAVLVYGIRATSGVGHRPSGVEVKRIERSVNIATVTELVTSIVLPIGVLAAGHSDWVLPSIAITIGSLVLWLDHLVSIPRLRLVGWTLSIGPLLLVATLSGTTLAATTGLTAGALLLAASSAGFHDLNPLRTRPTAHVNDRMLEGTI